MKMLLPTRTAVLTVYEDGVKVSEHQVEITEARTRTVKVALSSQGAMVQDITENVWRGPVRMVNFYEWERAESE